MPALLAVVSIGVRAQDASTPSEEHVAAATVSVIVVEAERAELHDSGVYIRVPADALDAPSLPELLADLPGVQVRSAGGLGSYSEASLRGSSGRQVRVLLDGLPLDAGGGEASSLSLISPLMLESVEIYKGRVPVSLGSGLAGTINLRSRDRLPEPLIGAAGLGTLGQFHASAAAQLGAGVQLAAGTQGAENDFRYRNPFSAFDPADPDRRREVPRRNAGTAQTFGQLRLDGPLRVGAQLLDDRQELPTRLNASDTRTQLDTRVHGISLASPSDHAWQVQLAHQRTREHYRDTLAQLGPGVAQDARNDTRRNLFAVSRELEWLQDRISVEHLEFDTEDRFGTTRVSSARRFTLGNALEVQAGELWRGNAGLNLAWSREQGVGLERREWQVEPALGLSHALGPCVAAANFGRRKRLPTFFERYGDRGLFRGNPGLEPERAIYGDLGTRCIGTGWLRRAELGLFAQDLRDVINPTYNAQGIGLSVNSGRARIAGAELALRAQLGTVDALLGGTWQDTEDRSQVSDRRGRRLPGRFEQQLNVRLETPLAGVVLHYAFRYESGQFYDTANLLPARTLRRHDVGLRGAWQRLGWSLQWLNLGDRNFEQFNGFPTPGQQVLFNLSWPATDSVSANSRSTAP